MEQPPEPHAPLAEPADRRPLKSRSYAWVQGLSKTLVAKGVTPNQISAAGVVIAAVGCAVLFAVSRGWLWFWIGLPLAAVCVQARLMCNLLDGLVAVEGGKKSKGGDLFNEIPDRIEDPLFLIGAGWACGHPQLGWLCAVLAVFVAYVRAFGASLGQGQDFGGPCAKPQRMAILTGGLLLSTITGLLKIYVNPLAWALWIIAAGTAVTAVLRIKRQYAKAP